MQISRLSHCSFPVFWYLYDVVHLLHMVHFHLQSLIIMQCFKIWLQLLDVACNKKCGTLIYHFFHSFMTLHWPSDPLFYLPMLLFSGFLYNSCSFLFLVFPVCMGFLSAILCSDLSIHIAGSPKMPCGH